MLPKLKYTVKITFLNGDVEHYMSEHTDVSKLLPISEVEEVKLIEISPNKINIPERYTSSLIYKNKELHLDTGNGDYIWIVNGEIKEEGCEPLESTNNEIVEFAKEIEL